MATIGSPALRFTDHCRPLVALGVLIATLRLCGCAAPEQPAESPEVVAVPAVSLEPYQVELPQTGELEVHGRALPPLGGVLPLEVSVRNLQARARTFARVIGITDAAARIDQFGLYDPPIAQNTKEILSVVSDNQSFLATAVEGTGGWPVLTMISLLGTPAAGLEALAISSAILATRSTTQRLQCYQLGGPLIFGAPARMIAPRDYAMDRGTAICGRNPGFVFLPDRHYDAIAVIDTNLLTGKEEVLTVPWSAVSGQPTAAHESSASHGDQVVELQ